MEKHLQDVSLYRPSSEKEYKLQCKHLNKEWVNTASAAVRPSLKCDTSLNHPGSFYFHID
ncbi:hypothetical protein KIN20_004433 [Parelaphostrongylus tenuis]|uniref:Uncharacterized protein n=1 Tax=Parelaphostrongylus tenuis TaxID=148309 RepID=A0AAD5LYG7_PARTN|nr:hypothetical protein KIN20_004433 [Parelaphostrongylus tenuis]